MRNDFLKFSSSFKGALVYQLNPDLSLAFLQRLDTSDELWDLAFDQSGNVILLQRTSDDSADEALCYFDRGEDGKYARRDHTSTEQFKDFFNGKIR